MNNYIYLSHHGIKGQKWGVRRYQNADGSLTSAGYKRMKNRDWDERRIREELSKQGYTPGIKESRRSLNREYESRISKMSDEEIRQRINRIDLENAYRSRVYKPSTSERVAKKAGSILEQILVKSASKALSDVFRNTYSGATKGVIKVIRNKKKS